AAPIKQPYTPTADMRERLRLLPTYQFFCNRPHPTLQKEKRHSDVFLRVYIRYKTQTKKKGWSPCITGPTASFPASGTPCFSAAAPRTLSGPNRKPKSTCLPTI